jgi:Ser/Thr protein kinase RdoA (MazF antagonist)
VADFLDADPLRAPVSTAALDIARRRIAAGPAPDRIAGHLQAQYGIAVSGLAELDLGVYRVDRADMPAWVLRVFPAARAGSAAAADAAILRFLEQHGFPSERAATDEPLSVLDGHTLLVTGFVPGVARAERAAVIRAHGGLRRLGELLGELHTLPAAGVPATRPGGGWHHLSDGGPADEIRAIQTLLAECADAAPAGQQAHAVLARELADADAGDGLPTALIHPDFVLANVIVSPERGMVFVDWTGAGQGPRAWSLAFLLYAEASKNPARAKLIVSGYRRHVRLEADEIERLPAMMAVRPVVLAAWSLCLGRWSAEQATRAAAEARQVAETVGPRIVEAWRARPS